MELNNIDEKINAFSEKEQEKLLEIIKAIEDLSSRAPITGFHHKFYIPGWIEIFQLDSVGRKMRKVAEKPFYNGKSYYEFANWILTMANQLSDLHLQTKPKTDGEDLKKYKEQSDFIIKLIMILIESWTHCYPEIATIINRKLDDNTMISLAGILYHSSKELLAPIGKMNISKGAMDTSFTEEFKGCFQQMLGIICNVIVFGIIAIFIKAIFELINLIFK